MAIAELRANTAYFLAKNIGERLIKPVPLERIPGATLESADVCDRDDGDFIRSASAFHTVHLESADPFEKIKGAVGVSRELINLGRFRQARPFLEIIIPTLTQELPYRRQAIYFEGERNNRLGWIADYEGGYFDSRSRFERVRELVGGIPEEERTEEERHLWLTAIHFLGRAHFGLASYGIEQKNNASKAVEYFHDGLELNQSGRARGENTAAVEGFNHAWISRCYQLLGIKDSAREHLEQAGELFKQWLESYPNRGIMAHYFLLRGFFRLQDGNLYDAQNDFEEAISIRTDSTRNDFEPYPKGLSDAYLGIVEVYKREWNLLQAVKYGVMAFRVYPFALLKTVAGG